MRLLMLMTALLLATTDALVAQDHKAGRVMHPDQLQWGPAPPLLPKGAHFTVEETL
jgi:hypothetical protein